MSLLERPSALLNQLEALGRRARLRVAFLPSAETAFMNYFPANLWEDFERLERDGIDVMPYSDAADVPPFDLVLLTAHGFDKTPEIFHIRRRFPAVLVCVWFWDNHIGGPHNLRSAVAADFVLASHGYAMDRLVNPSGALAMHLPSCCAQWPINTASRFYREFERGPRSGRLLVNYVDYKFSWRSPLLRQLASDAPETEVLTMGKGDRRRYFDKSPSERMQEWMSYKSTLILPVDRDLSTRVFDALLAGQVLVVPPDIPDFPEIVAPEMEAGLGIVRLPEVSVLAIRAAARIAARRFDEEGLAAARVRHEFVLSAHMLVHRVSSALECIRALIAGHLSIQFLQPANLPFGLYVTSNAG